MFVFAFDQNQYHEQNNGVVTFVFVYSSSQIQEDSYGEKEDEQSEAIRRGRSSVVYEMFSSGGIELGKAVSAVIVNYIFDLQLIFVKICGLKNKKL